MCIRDRSSSKVLAMEYLEGEPLDRFVQTNPDSSTRNRIGQKLWDLIDTMIRVHRHVHADPHPGNFQVSPDGQLQVLDFGCMKSIPASFFEPFFGMMLSTVHEDESSLQEKLTQLELLLPQDAPEERAFYTKIYRDFVVLLAKPFHLDTFDFSDSDYFAEIGRLSKSIQSSELYKSSKRGRGSKHALYVNRTYFGLYNLLHLLGATVQTGNH